MSDASPRTGRHEAHLRAGQRARAFAAIIEAARDALGLDDFFATDFVRDFSGVEALAQDRPFLRVQEYHDPDEQAVIDALVATFVADTTRDLPAGCAVTHFGGTNPDFIDPHWGHSTGYLRGTLTIGDVGEEVGVGQLPEALRVGLFAAPGRYETFGRSNFLYDPKVPIAINRMSLKLQTPFPVPNEYAESGEANEIDLLMSEGVPAGDPQQPDGQGFFFRDARQLLMVNEMKDGLLSAAEVLLDAKDAEVFRLWKERVFAQATDMLYSRPQTQTCWHGKWYFSAGPYRLGPGAMKFALAPLADERRGHVSIFDDPVAAHAADFERMGEVGFRLMVQVATPQAVLSGPGDPPACVMAAEYTDLAWNTDQAPFVPVGTLTLAPSREPPADIHAVGFNAWNTPEAMRPLGQLFRARRYVHAAHRRARLAHSFKGHASGAESACPFGR